MREQGYELTDEQWERIRPLLPPPARTGRPRADDRKNGILHVLRTGSVVRGRRRRGNTGYVYGMAEAEEVAGGGGMDSHLAGVTSKASFCGHGRSLMGASSRQKGEEEIGLTEVGKGTKRMLVVDGNGITFHLPGQQGRGGASSGDLGTGAGTAEEACGGQGIRLRPFPRPASQQRGDPLHTPAEEPQRPA